jgi:hypothetical protein
MLMKAGRLIGCGIDLDRACETAVVVPLTDDGDIRNALPDAIAACSYGRATGRRRSGIKCGDVDTVER